MAKSVAIRRNRVARAARLACLLLLAPLPAAGKPLDFNRDIRPILSRNCFACHGPDEHDRRGGLRLDDRDAATSQLESGATAIVPGEPAASELVVRIRDARAPSHLRSHRPAPNPAEVEAYLADASPDRHEKLVDRLLASPRHAERLAAWWLDLVRYADTVGYHGDQTFNISPYRDWVIKAFLDNTTTLAQLESTRTSSSSIGRLQMGQ